MRDLTPNVEVKVSSRQAMVSSLTDNSTETFWESGDEDRNKTKSINITCLAGTVPRIVYVHIDNARDLAVRLLSLIYAKTSRYFILYEDKIQDLWIRPGLC